MREELYDERVDVPRTAPLSADLAASQPWKAFTLLVVTYFITIVDFTIVNVALPTIGRELRFPESGLQWLVTAYGLTFAGFLLLGGRAADLLGRRRRGPGGPASRSGTRSSSRALRRAMLR